MARKTQTDAVLEWLQTGAGITSLDAFKELGVTRLSAIIFNLRRQGYDIESENVRVRNRFGNVVTVAKYYLKDSTEA